MQDAFSPTHQSGIEPFVTGETYYEAVLRLVNPLRYYRNIAGAALTDQGRAGVDGTAVSGLAQDGAVQVDGLNSLNLVAGDYVNFSAGDSPVIVGDLTLSFIYRIANGEMPTAGNHEQIIQHWLTGDSTATNMNYAFRIANDGGLVYQYFHEYGAGGTDDSTNFAAVVPIDNSDVHIVMTRTLSGKALKLFVNGTLATPATYTGDPTGGTSSRLSLGARHDGVNHFTNSLMSDILIEDSAITDGSAVALNEAFRAASP